MLKQVDSHKVRISEYLHPFLASDINDDLGYYSEISLRIAGYNVAIAECSDGWPHYLVETTNAIESYREQNPQLIIPQKPIDVTNYLPKCIQKSKNLREVRKGSKRVYSIFAPGVKKWMRDDKEKLIREGGNFVVDVSPHVIFLSQICTLYKNPITDEMFDLRFMANEEIAENGVYGFDISEMKNLEMELGSSFYMLTAENDKTAERNTDEFIKQHNGIIEKGIKSLIPESNLNRMWKKIAHQDVIDSCTDVINEVGKTYYVHPSIPHSLIGGMLKAGEIRAFVFYSGYGPTGIGINSYDDNPTRELLNILYAIDPEN